MTIYQEGADPRVMTNAERRAEQRINVQITGTLLDAEIRIPCFVKNVCSRGFLIQANASLPVGRAVALEVPLDRSRTVQCVAQVRHVNADTVGAMIVTMAPEDAAVYNAFLQQLRERKAAS